MLLAEELLLLALDDETGKVVVTEVDKGLAGAVLIELALRERVRATEKGEAGRAGRLVVTPGAATGHPVLDDALRLLTAKEGRKPKDVIGPLANGLRERLARGLVQVGVLRRERHKVLGFFPVERLPAQDSGHEATVRERIAAAQPDERTAALIALLTALNAVTTVFDVPDRRAARRRAKEIAEGQWAAAAVRKAVAEVYAATMAAAAVAATVATSG